MAKKKKNVLKRQRQEKKKRYYNKKIKEAIKKSIKDVKKAILTQKAEVQDMLKKTYKMIDKAVAKGVIHKNTAARKKSRLALFLKKYGKQIKTG
ncbi:MAG: 30S ribosomal protein S20 [bacterium]|nr:30S ribosomal protein S20 [bacterium]